LRKEPMKVTNLKGQAAGKLNDGKREKGGAKQRFNKKE